MLHTKCRIFVAAMASVNALLLYFYISNSITGGKRKVSANTEPDTERMFNANEIGIMFNASKIETMFNASINTGAERTNKTDEEIGGTLENYRTEKASDNSAHIKGHVEMLNDAVTGGINSDGGSIHKSLYIDLKLHLNTTGEIKDKKTILWWNAPGWLRNWYADVDMNQCGFTNCKVSFDQTLFHKSDAVVFSLTDKGFGYKPPIHTSMRNPDQAWIFFTLESPINVKLERKDFMSPHWRNMFNWSWTYRMDADIFHPYGTLVTKEIIPKRNYSEIFRKKKKMGAWVVSHCNTLADREKYENILNKYAKIDIYGKCGFRAPQDLESLISNDYKFYLGFENSLCNEYITEKFFHYYKMDVVTIVRGKNNYSEHLPKGSFINTADFPSIQALAKFMHELGTNEEEYINYLKIKDQYDVHERDFMYRDALCSICEKVNNLEHNRKTYKDIVNWLGMCYKANDLNAI